jgi:hypothetical protein
MPDERVHELEKIAAPTSAEAVEDRMCPVATARVVIATTSGSGGWGRNQ